MPAPAVLNVGFYNYVLTDKIVAMVSSESAPMRRLVQNMRKSGGLIDATQGQGASANGLLLNQLENISDIRIRFWTSYFPSADCP